MNKDSGFSLVEIIIVIALIGLLAAVTIITFKPQEIFANGRNTKRVGDIGALNTALGQWLSREGGQDTDVYATLGLTASGVTALTPSDGDITDEGVNATSVGQLALPAYLQIIPKDPDGITEYRVGVDDLDNPAHVLVCTGQIERTSTYSESQYPNGIFCLGN